MTAIVPTKEEMVQLLRQQGLNLIPLKPQSKVPLFPWEKYQHQKYDSIIPMSNNYAVVCGETSDNLVVVDVDKTADQDIVEKIYPGALTKTLVDRTGSGGFHIFLKVKDLPKTSRLERNDLHIDIQSSGTIAVGPGSTHPNGNKYQIISATATIATVDFRIEIQPNLKKLGLDGPAPRKPISAIAKGVNEGSRNDSAFKYAAFLLDTKKLDRDTTWYELRIWNETNNPPLLESELKAIFESAMKKVSHRVEVKSSLPQEESMKISNDIASMPLETYIEKLRSELEHCRKQIELNFPGRFSILEICLSVKIQQKIYGVTQVLAIILMAQPGSRKSTVLEIVNCLPGCYLSDSFTPKSFVSHSANTTKDKLGEVDLLPRIRHKTLITPELAPLFSGNPDQLIEYFGMLTRILDGRGYQSDSGVHGQRGYSGDYSFAWLGAVVDIPRRVWKVLGNLGPKIYFLRLPPDPDSTAEKHAKIKKNLKGDPYNSKLEASKEATTRFWEYAENRPGQDSNRKIVWDKERDDSSTVDRIIDLAQLLAKLRASVPTWHTSDSGGSNYNYETPVIEDPERASHALYNLARGHALLYGRNYITNDDLGVVISVSLSSASKERIELFRLLIDNKGKLDTEQFMELAQVSRATALKEMEHMKIIGLADKQEEEKNTKPVMTVKLKPEYDWFLGSEFQEYWEAFKTSHMDENSKLSKNEEDNLEKKHVSQPVQATVDDKYKEFLCKTCNAGPFDIHARSKSSGSILKFHQDKGHEIEFM